MGANVVEERGNKDRLGNLGCCWVLRETIGPYYSVIVMALESFRQESLPDHIWIFQLWDQAGLRKRGQGGKNPKLWLPGGPDHDKTFGL